MSKLLKMNSKHKIPFGKPDADGTILTREEAEEAVMLFRETGKMNVKVEGYANFKVLGVFIGYSIADSEEGDINISGEYEIDIHAKKE